MQESLFPGLLFWRYVNLTLYGRISSECLYRTAMEFSVCACFTFPHAHCNKNFLVGIQSTLFINFIVLEIMIKEV